MRKSGEVKVLEHIVEHFFLTDNSEVTLMNSITPDMFTSSDIKDVHKDKDADHFYVEFYGINGIIPMSFFSKESQDKILMWKKSRKSPLWEILNGD